LGVIGLLLLINTVKVGDSCDGRDCDLNPSPSAPGSSTLTTRLPSHPYRGLTTNRSVSSVVKSAVNMTLPAFAAAGRRRSPLTIDISCSRGAQQQTRRTPQWLLNDGTHRRTGRRTLDRYIDPAPHTMRTESKNWRRHAVARWTMALVER